MKKDPYAPLRDQMSQPPTHWRSLEQKDVPAGAAHDAEFLNPVMTPEGFNRRDVLKIAGASLALAGATGCTDTVKEALGKVQFRRPEEEILPYTRMPESVIPGVRMQYATAMNRSEGAVGLVIEAHEGRPTKIEGNPNHPSSLGGSDIWAQAEILKLYDPDRARTPLKGGAASTWAAWDAFATTLTSQLASTQGKGLAFLAEEDGGPTFERLLAEAQGKLPQAKVYRWDPLSPDRSQAGAQLAFGPGARAHVSLEKAKVLFALDSNFLTEGPDHLRLAREFGKSRAVVNKEDAEQMNRLYVAEGVFSTTGTNADHRIQVASGQGAALLRALARALAGQGLPLGELSSADAPPPAGTEKFLVALAKDLVANKGASVVLVGERQPAAVHALAQAINAALGSTASGIITVTLAPNSAVRTSMLEQLTALNAALLAGEVSTLVVFDANPLYTAPGTLKFGDSLSKAGTVIHVGVLAEETGAKAAWHLPSAHFLELWGDARAWNGTASIVQPLVLPLFGSRPATSLLAQLTGHAVTEDRKLVEETWRAPGLPLADQKAWRRALHDGLIANSARAPVAAAVRAGEIAAELAKVPTSNPSATALELCAIRSHVLDGRLANVTWLQELPEGMSKLCWDNALLMSPALAKELNIESAVRRNSYTSDLVELQVDGRKITVPTFVLPGLSKYSTALVQGYGKTAGEVAKGVGVDVQPLLADNSGVVQNVKLTKTGATQVLCSTQEHFSVPANPYKEMTFAQMTGLPKSGDEAYERQLGLGRRPLFRSGTAEQMIKEGGKFAHEGDMPSELVELGTPKNRPSKPHQPHGEVTYEGQQWGMTIDLASCIGCNACAIACVAENNIPVVGREQVLLGRELHWIRIDRYYSGDVDNPVAMHQPVPCMQCENAPCEPVCPVSATSHDEEGLNAMAYNRCIGTRYCSNNCPFKVRRFNYLDFSGSGNIYVNPVLGERMKSLKLQRNPDVTVRYRGVMEKCTYCTQRIEEAKIAAKRAGHDRKGLPDGAVTPACAQACPTQAITFGNINDPLSRVAKLKESVRNYEMLQELDVRPRTTFLARVKNENQELA